MRTVTRWIGDRFAMIAALLGTPSATELHVMTLNIRRDLGAL